MNITSETAIEQPGTPADLPTKASPGPLVERPPTAITQGAASEADIAPILQLVIDGKMTPADLKEILAIQQNYEAGEARKAFHLALAEFKRHPPKVIKDMANNQFGSMYASLGAMVDAANVAMGQVGLSARWDYPIDPSRPRAIGVRCILTHEKGHSESVEAWGEPDTTGKKNDLQQSKSTRTYLKADTFSAVTGVVAQNAELNDDGNAAGSVALRINPDQVAMIQEAMLETGSEDRALTYIKKAAHVDRVEDLTMTAFPRILKKLKEQAKKSDKPTTAEGSDNDNS